MSWCSLCGRLDTRERIARHNELAATTGERAGSLRDYTDVEVWTEPRRVLTMNGGPPTSRARYTVAEAVATHGRGYKL